LIAPAAASFDNQITDLMGSLTFVLLAVLTMVLGAENDPLGYTKRRITLTAIIAASRTELALFLWYRVVKRGKDARFDEIRSSFWVRFIGLQAPLLASRDVGCIYLTSLKLSGDCILVFPCYFASFVSNESSIPTWWLCCAEIRWVLHLLLRLDLQRFGERHLLEHGAYCRRHHHWH
jgi:steroid 5-alpha reductase family enzyme